MSTTETLRLTSLSHGGGCGCKIDPGILRNLLAEMPSMAAYESLLVGNETADDAAVFKINDTQAVIATTDFFMPIVDDPFDFGQIAATNALSDIYAMGGQPIMALAIVGMPINVLPHEHIARILSGGARACQLAGIPIAGGHSIDSVEPIYGLAAIGLVHPDQIKKNDQAQAGDVLILTKPLGVGILSAAFKKDRLDAIGYRAMVDSMTRLNSVGTQLGQYEGVHAMTDITGFGLLGHAWEMARGSQRLIELDFERLPWLPDSRQLAAQGMVTGASKRNWAAYGAHIELAEHLDQTAQHLLTDPQTSGGLLISCAPESASEIMQILTQHGFNQAAVIGRVLDEKAGVRVS